MAIRRMQMSVVAAATALTVAIAGVPAAQAVEGTKVEVSRDGSSGFNFNSSGKDVRGEEHANQVNSSRDGFTSSNATGEQAAKQQQSKNDDLSSDSTIKTLVTVLAVAAIFVAGYNYAVVGGMLPR
ncbi:hypothetical protein ACFPVT_08540 [Corynebacterium choanae]|uniref:Secreted protein n=1 Tax=Corynebacterium choanae TaxID=1862358 RepID=A0A3G6JB70_9CORY|nr:hypothetical protein [Corynebacterium choanae]AZA13304.1 hypothetical protein CCHOA_04480 [Corynebacterium choanae]